MDYMEDDAQGGEGDTIPRDPDYALAPDPQIFTLAFDENMSLREQSHQLRRKEGLTMKLQFSIERTVQHCCVYSCNVDCKELR